MIKRLMISMVRRRNPQFDFDPAVSDGEVIEFMKLQLRALLRGCRLWWRGRASKSMLLGRGVRFFNLGKIQWGRYVRLGDQVFISALARQGVLLGNAVSIGAFSRVVVSTTLNDPGSLISIGNNVGIGEFAYLGGAGGLVIGDDCIIGQYFSCHPENHLYSSREVPIRRQGVKREGIVIGRDCWIGSRVTILDGVTIGDGCVIAAGAVVTRSVPPYSVIAGVPARVIRMRPEGSKIVYSPENPSYL